MGKCHVLIKKVLLSKILLDHHDDGQAVVVVAKKWGNDDDLYYCEIESKNLPEGYHGFCDLIVDKGRIKYKQDLDV